jgi:electron transfer flavoprotein beta subunit
VKILVCLKRVVDTETRVKVAADGRSIELGGVQFIVAPYDEMAVERALQLRDAAGSGTVTVLTVGPEAATKELRSALAMGADDALHVVVEGRLDAAQTAAEIHAVVKDRGFDLLLFGKQATDEDDAAVGPLVAASLDLPCVAFVQRLDVEGGRARAEREIDGERETLEVDLPAVFTAQKGLAEPRYPGLKGIMAAKKKPLETLAPTGAPARTERRALSLPPARQALRTIPPTAEGLQALLVALRDERKVL